MIVRRRLVPDSHRQSDNKPVRVARQLSPTCGRGTLGEGDVFLALGSNSERDRLR